MSCSVVCRFYLQYSTCVPFGLLLNRTGSSPALFVPLKAFQFLLLVSVSVQHLSLFTLQSLVSTLFLLSLSDGKNIVNVCVCLFFYSFLFVCLFTWYMIFFKKEFWCGFNKGLFLKGTNLFIRASASFYSVVITTLPVMSVIIAELKAP